MLTLLILNIIGLNALDKRQRMPKQIKCRAKQNLTISFLTEIYLKLMETEVERRGMEKDILCTSFKGNLVQLYYYQLK